MDITTYERYMQLQNGSDIRGVALEGVAGESVNLTPDIIKNIASAFATYIIQKVKKSIDSITIAVGHDSRVSAEFFKKEVLLGIQRVGCIAIDCSLASTPSMFMATVLEPIQCDGAIMITASHLPYNRNGLKFFTNQGGLESDEIKEILTIAASIKKDGNIPDVVCPIQKLDLISYYSAYLKAMIKKEVNHRNYEKPLEGLHIVVDASNGSGGFFANTVLEPLGADITGSLCLEPDGMFPNHIPNPEDQGAMESIQQATLKHKADIGIIFDTDVDRMSAVFSNGKEINKNAIVALMSAIVASQYPGTTVVTDSVTSNQLSEFLENKLKLKHHRFKRGYKNVINEAIRLNKEGIETHLAIETSGHGAFKENYFLDDGAYLSVKIICELVKCKRDGKSIDMLIKDLEEPLESIEYRLPIKTTAFKEYGDMVLDKLKQYAEIEETFHIEPVNYEGVRINFNDNEVKGFMLLRMSLHDPIMPLNIETDSSGGVEIIVKRLMVFLQQYKDIDLSVIK